MSEAVETLECPDCMRQIASRPGSDEIYPCEPCGERWALVTEGDAQWLIDNHGKRVRL